MADAFDSWLSNIGDGVKSSPSNSFNFMDYVNGGMNLGKQGMDFLNNNSKGLSALGGLWGAYSQYDMGNKMFDMQKQAFNYNRLLSEREKKRQEDAEQAMQLGFANSSYGRS